jgi:hypothetical protein
MPVTQAKPRPRRAGARRGERVIPAGSVRELLLELAYRLHATRVVRVPPEAARAAGPRAGLTAGAGGFPAGSLVDGSAFSSPSSKPHFRSLLSSLVDAEGLPAPDGRRPQPRAALGPVSPERPVEPAGRLRPWAGSVT